MLHSIFIVCLYLICCGLPENWKTLLARWRLQIFAHHSGFSCCGEALSALSLQQRKFCHVPNTAIQLGASIRTDYSHIRIGFILHGEVVNVIITDVSLGFKSPPNLWYQDFCYGLHVFHMDCNITYHVTNGSLRLPFLTYLKNPNKIQNNDTWILY